MPPAVNDKQANFFRMALASKKGVKLNAKNPAVTRIAQTLSAKKIKEFTKTK
jgi:hypothetical protein